MEEEKYLCDFDFLAEDVRRRKEKKTEIRERIDFFARNTFGIKNYSALMNSEFGESDELKVTVCCQVATANIEHVSAQFFAEWLKNSGLPAVACFSSFVNDSFSYANEYKKSLVRMRWLKKKEKTGQLFVEGEKIVDKKHGDISDWILARIITKDGTNLPEFHKNIMSSILKKPYCSTDASDLFEECLRQCIDNQGTAPEYYYVVDGNRDKKVEAKGYLSGEKIRPPASWFYYLHLLAFLDGERALVNQVDDCHKIEKCFSDSIDLIKREIGIEPLIINTPKNVNVNDYKSNLYEINGALSNWDEDKFITPKSKNLFSAMREIEEELIVFN